MEYCIFELRIFYGEQNGLDRKFEENCEFVAVRLFLQIALSNKREISFFIWNVLLCMVYNFFVFMSSLLIMLNFQYGGD